MEDSGLEACLNSRGRATEDNPVALPHAPMLWTVVLFLIEIEVRISSAV